ncbi:hypothetical protein BZ425_15370 [Salmonella enterica subsp. enterica serovar Enteritidis]|nr:hypothetical protein [Salmonella enterica subsp. enterica serovar Weltevreden]ECI7435521.1 hypothetical protein [Salmonella enterica subsp. enterica serovar Kentucky]EDF0871545.1 hypothetical protein [Salmonella enterica subsp. enterica serovar Enteritidis]HCJ5732674.1 hypothetical protein [Escherichia coli]HCJ8494800.1 hypothetical protein [Escherichia coli]
MNKFNILDAKIVSESSIQQEIFRVQFGEKVLNIPRPVMIGLAIFVNNSHCNGSALSVLEYGNYQFYIPEHLEYNRFIELKPFYKFMLDAGYSILTKTYIRDYSKLESFYRARGFRVPQPFDGYQTRVVLTAPLTKELASYKLDIEQKLLRDDLLKIYNQLSVVPSSTISNIEPEYGIRQYMEG